MPALPGSLVGSESVAYDLFYGARDSPFVEWARRHGAANALKGWGMLIEQAAESFFIWRGVRPDTKPVLRQLVR
jgi:shikimate dehydrogenase